MANDQLTAFVGEALARGVARPDIAEALRRAGWSGKDVTAALAGYADIAFPVPVPKPRPSLSAREAFLYLLLFTTLYIVAFNLGSLIFEFINRAFPDPADGVTEGSVLQAIRWSVSSLIVAFPVFVYVSRLTGRTAAGDPEAASPVRRWLTYLTLFVAACVLLGDVMTLVYSLLGGELTVRFVLKVLTIGVIAGTVFWHYLSGLRVGELDAQAASS